MKAIFLDIDGVLCTARSHLAIGHPLGDRIWNAWDPVGCACIREVCKTGVKIVVSSTWRIPQNEPELKEKMAYHGLTQYVRMPNWKTPDLSLNGSLRGHEVGRYLAENPDIEDYRIIDDMNQFLDSQSDKVILTDPDEGMTHKNIQSLFRWAGVLKS